MSGIPASRQAECEQCRMTIDRNGPRVARLCTAWVRNRKGGGANALVAPVWTERYLCRFCADDRAKGVEWRQERLFDDPADYS